MNVAGAERTRIRVGDTRSLGAETRGQQMEVVDFLVRDSTMGMLFPVDHPNLYPILLVELQPNLLTLGQVQSHILLIAALLLKLWQGIQPISQELTVIPQPSAMGPSQHKS